MLYTSFLCFDLIKQIKKSWTWSNMRCKVVTVNNLAVPRHSLQAVTLRIRISGLPGMKEQILISLLDSRQWAGFAS